MKKTRTFWGLFFILAAVLLVAGQLNLLGGMNISTILLTAFLVFSLLKSIRNKSINGVIYSIAFLCIVYAEPLNIEVLSPWTILLAAILCSIGCSFLFHKKEDKIYYDFEKESSERKNNSYVTFNTTFASSIKYIDSSNFKGGSLHCSFGSMKLYFDNAEIIEGNAYLKIDAAFSGIKLYIPKYWNIMNHMELAFADVVEKTNKQPTLNAPTLILQGNCSFSGIEIYYI